MERLLGYRSSRTSSEKTEVKVLIKANKLKLATMKRKREVMKVKVELIKEGFPPAGADKLAKSIIAGRWRDELVKKSGG